MIETGNASNRTLILVAVLLVMTMIAIEATIVATAMPRIAGELGGIDLYSWVFSSFLLAQTATTLVFGKLADIFGRRRLILSGLSLFSLGSLACGFAPSMPLLIVCRVLQGIGAGAMHPVSVTVIGDLYPGAERGKVQGYLASVWAVASVSGPLIGGLLLQHLGWGWVFWINLPLCALAAGCFTIYLEEVRSDALIPVDWLGALLLIASVIAIMVAISTTASSVLLAAVLGCVGSVCAIAFIRRNRNAHDPILDFQMLTRPVIAICNLGTAMASAVMMGLTGFLPIYVQSVLGQTPTTAGFALTAMLFSWPISATFAARNLVRFGIKPLYVTGGALLPVGGAILLCLRPRMSPFVAGSASLIIGAGLGLLNTIAIIVVQASAEHRKRGAATAANLFARNLGGTIGMASFGALLSLGIKERPGLSMGTVHDLLTGNVTFTDTDSLRAALGDDLWNIFFAILLICFLTALATMFLPSGLDQRPIEQ